MHVEKKGVNTGFVHTRTWVCAIHFGRRIASDSILVRLANVSGHWADVLDVHFDADDVSGDDALGAFVCPCNKDNSTPVRLTEAADLCQSHNAQSRRDAKQNNNTKTTQEWQSAHVQGDPIPIKESDKRGRTTKEPKEGRAIADRRAYAKDPPFEGKQQHRPLPGLRAGRAGGASGV